MAEAGDLDANPVAKDLEVFKVIAGTDEMVERGESTLELFVQPLPLIVLHRRRCAELEEGEQAKEYGCHLMCVVLCVEVEQLKTKMRGEFLKERETGRKLR